MIWVWCICWNGKTLRTEMGRLWVAKCHLFGFKLVFLPNPCCSAQKWLPFAWHGSFPLLHWRVRRFQRWVRGWCQMQTKLLTWQMLRGTVAEKLALRLLNVCKDILCATSVGRGGLQRACQMWSQTHTNSTFLAIRPTSQQKNSRNNKMKNNILMNLKFTMWRISGFKFLWALPEDPMTSALKKKWQLWSLAFCWFLLTAAWISILVATSQIWADEFW